MTFDRKKFFDGFRPYFREVTGKLLSQDQVNGLEFLLAAFEQSEWFSSDIRFVAYALATIHIETYLPKTNSRYVPVTESGGKSYFLKYDKSQNPRKARSLGNTQVGDGCLFRGRGYVQITGRTNYRKFGIENEPDKALDPQTAFSVMEVGMMHGIFTTRRLDEFINDEGCDYKGARRVINGQDRAGEIAGYARNFEHFLRESEISAAAASLPDLNQNEPTVTNEPVEATNEPENPQADSNGTEQITQPPIQNADQIINTGNVASPTTAPQDLTIATAKPSWKTTIGAALTALWGYYQLAKENVGELVDRATGAIDAHILANAFIGAGLIALAYWFYNRSQERAHEKTLALIKTAADPAQNTISLTDKE